MISVDEAWALLERHRLALPAEPVPLDAALDRTLTSDLKARVTRPEHAVSAMDGYAVRSSDISGIGSAFEVIGEAPAGRPFDGRVGEREAVRIFTGSNIPAGADHVIIQEDVVRDGSEIRLTAKQDGGTHIRAAGIDFENGDKLLEARTNLGPAEIATIAAADHGEVEVTRKLKVAIIANGDELREPGTDPAIGDVVASNYFGLSALVRRWGGEPINCGIAADSMDAICDRIEAASDADVIVPVGGASVGDHDHMFAAFTKLGLEPIFQKIAVKPGKPTWFGKLGEQCVLGLPGNPASAYVCAHLFLQVLMQGSASLEWHSAKLADGFGTAGPRETFHRGVVTGDENGVSRIRILNRQDSSLITPFVEANCLVRRTSKADALEVGDCVRYLNLAR